MSTMVYDILDHVPNQNQKTQFLNRIGKVTKTGQSQT